MFFWKDFPEIFWSKVSNHAKDFVQQLLQVDPSNRMTAEQALQHPWLCTPIISPTVANSVAMDTQTAIHPAIFSTLQDIDISSQDDELDQPKHSLALNSA